MTKKQNAASLSLNVFDLIENVCEDFREAWKHGARPRIEEFLGKAPEQASKSLFRNLLYVEIQFRRNRGESLSSSEYANRFPQYEQVIRRAFDEPSIVSNERLQASDNPAYTVTQELPAANRLGSFELIRELGRGGFGVVYEARHAENGNVVALKTLLTGLEGQSPNADRLYRFRHEFRRLCEINHPNLVGMQTLEVDDSQWFFTMDLVDGEDFLSFVRPHDELHEDRLRACLKQLAKGILELHQRGIIHRDLKPGNLLVSSTGHLTVLDFGLAAQLPTATELTQTKSGMFAGTPTYAAPEQLFGQRTEASDWYALGTMLYEALVGERPFRHSDPMTLLRMKQEQEAPRLADQEGLPADLSSLVDGLLRREPGSRLTGAEVGQVLGIDDTLHHSDSTHDSREAENTDTSSTDGLIRQDEDLIGRREQISALCAAKQTFLKTLHPEVAWVTGRSGEGKTTLLENFLREHCDRDEVIVFSGRCYDRESVPYKAIDSFIDPLVGFLRSTEGSEVVKNLPADIDLLSQLFPLLERVEEISQHPNRSKQAIPPDEIRARGFYAFRMLLNQITLNRPVILVIDDLQWGDAGSATALMEVLTQQPAPAVLLLGSYRKDEEQESDFLNCWKQLAAADFRSLPERLIEVGPLTSQQCLEIAARRIQFSEDLLEQQAQELFANTTGNPYFLEQLISELSIGRGLEEKMGLLEIVTGRLANLPHSATELLELVAIAGQPIDLNELVLATGRQHSASGVLTAMRNERLVRLIGRKEHPKIDTYHDKIREVVLANIDHRTQQKLHLLLAEAIEKQLGMSASEFWIQLEQSSTPAEFSIPISPRIFDLVTHFANAKDSRSTVYQFLAAELALSAKVADKAIFHYQQISHKLPPESSHGLNYRMKMGLAKALTWDKQSDRAIACYEHALQHSESDIQRAHAWAGMLEAHTHVAKFDRAIECYDQFLLHLGKSRPTRMAGKLFSFSLNATRVLCLPATWQKTQRLPIQNRCKLETEVTNKITRVLFEKDTVAGFERAFASSVSGFRTGSREHVAIAHSIASSYFSILGLNALGRVCLKRVRAQRRAFPTETESAISDFAQADGNYFAGNLDTALTEYERCEPKLRRVGEFYWLFYSMHMRRHAKTFVGTTVEELRAANQLLKEAEEVGNVQHICFGNYDVAAALARAGKLGRSVEFISRAYEALHGEAYQMAEAIRASTDSYVRLQCSDYTAARRLSKSAWHKSVKHFCLIDVTLFCLPLLIESIAGCDWLASPNRETRRELRRMTRLAKLLYATLPNHQAHLQRTFGRSAAAIGSKGKAVRHFKKAIRVASSKGMAYQMARSMLDLAAVQESERSENRAEAIRLLKEMKSVIPRAESWQLGDQYDESVVAPPFDIAAWEHEHGCISDIQEPD